MLETLLTSIIVEPDNDIDCPLGITKLLKKEIGTKTLSWYKESSKNVGELPVSKEPVTE